MFPQHFCCCEAENFLGSGIPGLCAKLSVPSNASDRHSVKLKLEIFLQLFGLFLCLLPLGDVTHYGNNERRSGDHDVPHVDLDREKGAFFGAGCKFQKHQVDLLKLPDMGLPRGRIAQGRLDVHYTEPEQLIAGIPQQLAGAVVQVGKATGGRVHNENTVVGLIDKVSEEQQPGLSPLVFCNFSCQFGRFFFDFFFEIRIKQFYFMKKKNNNQ
ncbi:MAG: hypothetical protein Q8K68_12835 [Nitrospirota bacterium]|nr:hypothetical protein [Nitrospirota bacterium]